MNKVFAQNPSPADFFDTTPSVGFSGNFGQLLNFFITWAIVLGAIASLAMILMGGFKYMMAQDDPDKAEGGRKTITNGVIGLIIVASAFVIWKLVVNLLNVSDFIGI